MAGSAVAVEKRPMVCARNDCTKCSMFEMDVPQDCEYAILHLLDTEEHGFFQRPRRSGKTTALVQMASQVAERGGRAYFITHNLDMVQRLRRYNIHKDVVTMSKHNVDRQMRGMGPGWVFVDEVLPGELPSWLMSGVGMHRVVTGFYTP